MNDMRKIRKKGGEGPPVILPFLMCLMFLRSKFPCL